MTTLNGGLQHVNAVSETFDAGGEDFSLSISGSMDHTTMIALERLGPDATKWEGRAVFGHEDIPMNAATIPEAEVGACIMKLLVNASGLGSKGPSRNVTMKSRACPSTITAK